MMLKPCPFCGGNAYLREARCINIDTILGDERMRRGKYYSVLCFNDNCRGGQDNTDLNYSSPEAAIEA